MPGGMKSRGMQVAPNASRPAREKTNRRARRASTGRVWQRKGEYRDGTEIIIKSLENGWETERKLELPEDEGLVKSILRSVRRRVTPPVKTGGVIGDQEPEEERVLEAPEAEDGLEHTDVETVFETGARGFLLICCRNCGKEYAFHAREPMKSSVCRACGHETPLEELAIAELRCQDCGRTWRYHTNSEEPEITCRCTKCGKEMTGRRNGKLRRYLPRE